MKNIPLVVLVFWHWLQIYSPANCIVDIQISTVFEDQASVDLEITCPGGPGEHTGGILTLASDQGPGYTFTVGDDDFPSFSFSFLDGETLTASLVLNTTGSGDLSYSGNQFASGSTPQETLFHGVSPNEVNLNSIITPGIIDLSSNSTTQDITISYSFFVLGYPPNFEITISSLENLVKTTVAQFDNINHPAVLTNNFVDEADSFGSATFSIDFSLYQAGNYLIDVAFDNGSSSFPDAGSFEIITAGEPGSSQNNPILPDSIDENGNFIFSNIPGNTSFWMDPPLAFGYVYQTTDEALIASIDALPVGIDPDGLFTLRTPDQTYENVSVSDSFDFTGEANGGIRWFAITDVGPVDAADTAAFPIQMTFTETADLCITPLKIPEITSMALRVADNGDPRQPSGWFVDIIWTSQIEFEYRLESSLDLVTWNIANTAIGNQGLQGSGATNGISAFSATDKAFFRVQTTFLGPNLKGNGSGGGPVVVTPPTPNPFWPFGPPLPPLPDSFDGFAINFTTVGDIGNDPDAGNGLGAVDYEFRMAWYEVSRSMIEAYNTSEDNNPVITMADMTNLGGNGPDQPATGISWNEAARFVNWLNTSQGHSPAYKFITTGPNDNIALWTPGEPGYEAGNPYRNSEAKYFLPNENEWYKTAYHVAGGTGYYDYPTGSNTGPTPVSSGTTPNTAVWNNQSAPTSIYLAGGFSPHETWGQGGNVWEWVESAFDGSNDSTNENRITQGGAWNTTAGIHSGSWSPYGPAQEDQTVGFRVASKP